uniref:Cyclic nucleotide-binding domain-containing protein n=1 Tax=Clastoptera arizonana TaxID=38151 RepID=A0A1B6C0H4_9HEMI
MASSLSVCGSIFSRRSRRQRTRKKKLSPKTKFRALVRQVIENASWLESLNYEGIKLGHSAKTNVRIIQSQIDKSGLKLGQEKVVLRKHPSLRTQEELEPLYRTLGRLKYFRLYPEEVYKQLIACSYYVYFKQDRTLIRQGHVSTFMAIILTGDVAIYITQTDPVFGNEFTEKVNSLTAGCVFGEVSLMYEGLRLATVITTSPVELLVIYKEDFNSVLHDTLESQWSEIIALMKKIPYFSSWDQKSIKDCCKIADVKHYEENDIIIGPKHEKKYVVQFISKGRCYVGQLFFIEKKGKTFELSKSQKRQKSYNENVRCIFMQTLVLSEGACLGIGEDLGSRSIIAQTRTTILRIPLYILEQRNCFRWKIFKMTQQIKFPTDEECFQQFLENRRWEDIVKCFMRDERRNKTNVTSINDVPAYIRAKAATFEETGKLGVKKGSIYRRDSGVFSRLKI